MTTEPAELVTEFCALWAKPDLETILGYFTEDAVYHNIPMAPAVGLAAIRQLLPMMLDGNAWRDYFDLATVTAGLA